MKKRRAETVVASGKASAATVEVARDRSTIDRFTLRLFNKVMEVPPDLP